MLRQITIMKKLCFVVLVLFSSLAIAQSSSLEGTITDLNDTPLPGVNVFILNTTKKMGKEAVICIYQKRILMVNGKKQQI